MMGKKIAVLDFDSADYLGTPQDIAAYLDEDFADGDEALIAEALGVIARSKGHREDCRGDKPCTSQPLSCPQCKWQS
jgi:DNA-binding phage protein